MPRVCVRIRTALLSFPPSMAASTVFLPKGMQMWISRDALIGDVIGRALCSTSDCVWTSASLISLDRQLSITIYYSGFRFYTIYRACLTDL